MEEFEMTESPGFFSRLFNRWRTTDVFEDEDLDDEPDRPLGTATRNSSRMDVVRIHETRYTVCVRREVFAFEDALSAAKSFKAGDQQILNLTQTEPVLRKTIEDFLSGVAFGLEGSFDAVAPHVYLLAPRAARVDLAPAAEPVASLYGDLPNWDETGT
jgi:FtsZ-interacting cell division protein YlmF